MSISSRRPQVVFGLLIGLLTGSAVAQEAPVADLVLSMTATTTAVEAGSDIQYTITVRNEGAGDAADVVVTDILPSDVTLKSCTATDGVLCKIDSVNDRLVTVTFASIPGRPSVDRACGGRESNSRHNGNTWCELRCSDLRHLEFRQRYDVVAGVEGGQQLGHRYHQGLEPAAGDRPAHRIAE